MAADDIAKGVLRAIQVGKEVAPKSKSFISQILGTADEAISPGVRKAVANVLIGDGHLSTIKAKKYLESGASKEALERMRALTLRVPKNETRGYLYNKEALNQILDPWKPNLRDRAGLMHNYQGLGERARSIVLSEISKTANRLDAAQLAEELKHTPNLLPPKFDYGSNQIPQTDALIALGSRFPEFQGTIFSDQLATEFGGNSPAVGMFDAFISDGMSPSDAREAVRALLG